MKPIEGGYAVFQYGGLGFTIHWMLLIAPKIEKEMTRKKGPPVNAVDGQGRRARCSRTHRWRLTSSQMVGSLLLEHASPGQPSRVSISDDRRAPALLRTRLESRLNSGVIIKDCRESPLITRAVQAPEERKRVPRQ